MYEEWHTVLRSDDPPERSISAIQLHPVVSKPGCIRLLRPRPMGIYERIFQKDVPVSWILICSKGHEARCLSLDNGLALRVIAKILEVLTSLGMVQGRVCSDTGLAPLELFPTYVAG